MSQDSNNKDLEKNLEKNFKLMAMSAVVLLILFVYTIYKSSSHIQGSSYYIGIIFLFILLFLALLLKVKQDNHSNINFVITKGLGHRKIYHDAEVNKAIINFM